MILRHSHTHKKGDQLVGYQESNNIKNKVQINRTDHVRKRDLTTANRELEAFDSEKKGLLSSVNTLYSSFSERNRLCSALDLSRIEIIAKL